MNHANRLTRDNPRYQRYLDTKGCFQLSKECPSVYGGYEVVEGFEYNRIGMDGVSYYGILPMTRCVLGTNFVGKTGMMHQSFYDAESDQPEYDSMYHRTIHSFYEDDFRRIHPYVSEARTIALDCGHYASYRKIGLDSTQKNYVDNPTTYYYTPTYDVVGED